MLNIIWTININDILRLKKSENIPDVNNIARKIRGDIITFTKAYPRKQVSKEMGKLHLSHFLASHEIAS